MPQYVLGEMLALGNNWMAQNIRKQSLQLLVHNGGKAGCIFKNIVWLSVTFNLNTDFSRTASSFFGLK